MCAKLKLTDLKRKAIIKAATSEFYKNGYVATSMDSIAKAANVSKRTVYNHFSTKQKLFDAIMNELLNMVFENDFPPYDPNSPLKKQLFTLIRQELNMLMTKNFIKLARIITSELLRTPAKTNTFWEDIHRKKRASFFWLEDAIADGRLAIKSTDKALRQLGALIKEFIFWPQILSSQAPPSPKELDEIVNSAVDIFLNYYEVK